MRPRWNNVGTKGGARAGFTLVEILVVLLLLALVAGLATSRLSATKEEAKRTVAKSEMATIREALVNGLVADLEPFPEFIPASPLLETGHNESLDAWNVTRIHCLFTTNVYEQATSDITVRFEQIGFKLEGDFGIHNPDTGRGWNGPYLQLRRTVQNTNPTNRMFPAPGDRRFEGDDTFWDRGFFFTAESKTNSFYGNPGDMALGDPWGNPYVVQVPEWQAFPIEFHPPFRSYREFAWLRWRFARLVSAGPNGRLETPRDDYLAGMDEHNDVTVRGDDIVLFLNRQDVYEEVEP